MPAGSEAKKESKELKDQPEPDQRPEVEYVHRTDWKQLKFQRSFPALIIDLLGYLFLFAVSELLILLSLTVLGSVDLAVIDIAAIIAVTTQILTLLMPALAVPLLLAIFISIRRWRSTEYIIRSPEYKIVGDFVDNKPGQIIIESGETKALPVNKFEQVQLAQSWTGKIFGYADVVLVPDPDSNQNRELLRYVDKPKECLMRLQETIDISLGGKSVGVQQVS